MMLSVHQIEDGDPSVRRQDGHAIARAGDRQRPAAPECEGRDGRVGLRAVDLAAVADASPVSRCVDAEPAADVVRRGNAAQARIARLRLDLEDGELSDCLGPRIGEHDSGQVGPVHEGPVERVDERAVVDASAVDAIQLERLLNPDEPSIAGSPDASTIGGEGRAVRKEADELPDCREDSHAVGRRRRVVRSVDEPRAEKARERTRVQPLAREVERLDTR